MSFLSKLLGKKAEPMIVNVTTRGLLTRVEYEDGSTIVYADKKFNGSADEIKAFAEENI